MRSASRATLALGILTLASLLAPPAVAGSDFVGTHCDERAACATLVLACGAGFQLAITAPQKLAAGSEPWYIWYNSTWHGDQPGTWIADSVIEIDEMFVDPGPFSVQIWHEGQLVLSASTDHCLPAPAESGLESTLETLHSTLESTLQTVLHALPPLP